MFGKAKTHFVEGENIKNFQYYLYNNPYLQNKSLNDQLVSVKTYKFKFHLNFDEDSFAKNKQEIVKAIDEAASEAKIGSAIPSFKYYEMDYELFRLCVNHADFFSNILSHANDENLLSEVRANFGNEEPNIYQEYKDAIEEAITNGGIQGLIALAKENYVFLMDRVAHMERLHDKGQVTLYILNDPKTSDLAEKLSRFIMILEQKLDKLKIVCSKEMNSEDSTLTRFASFRQEELLVDKEVVQVTKVVDGTEVIENKEVDKTKVVERFQVDEELQVIYQPADVAKLKEQQGQSELYKSLVQECQKLQIYVEKPEAQLLVQTQESALAATITEDTPEQQDGSTIKQTH